MKILFVMRSTVYVRNFESTLRQLAARGHEIEVVAEPHAVAGGVLERIAADHPGVRHVRPPAVRFSPLSFLGHELRNALDYLRYLEPAYADANRLRHRATRSAPAFVITATQHRALSSAAGRRWFARVLRWGDRAIPREPEMDEFMRRRNPDLVLVTPLVEPGSPQSEYLRSARALGIRTGLCVYSWDNLTNKGLIHEPLDLVTVWNEAMKQEAVSLHGVPAARVVVTGAAAYDHWFSWGPRAARDAFCARVGLPPDRPYVLYLCSSKFIAPKEVGFVRTLVGRLREASPRLREIGVLVRPHPQNTDQWATADLSDLERVAVWPRAGGNPVDSDSRADYYDSIYHSAAVVGVNTSAQIESAIVGRSVHTLLSEEFRDTQEGTLHFRHLREGGLLHVARNHAELVGQLEAAIATPQDDGRGRRFLEAFVRPHGLDVPATPRLVEAIEATAALGRARPERAPWWSALARPVLSRVATPVAATKRADKERQARRRLLDAERDAARAAQLAARVAQQAERLEAKRKAGEERDRRKHEAQIRRAAAHDANRRTGDDAFERYLAVRERVRAMGDGAMRDDRVALTVAEQQIASALAPLWDATPEMIAALRVCAGDITGVQASDYAEPSPELESRLIHDRRILRQQADDLYVPEPGVLGGFGIRRKDDLFNEDSLRFTKALVALADAAVLPAPDEPRRALVWEIGGGWGGFAHAFTHVRPHVTYLVTGMPEQLLVSAAYLATVRRDARSRFFTAGQTQDELWRDWERVDFVFAPESAVPVLQPPRLDLVMDLMAMRLMSSDRVAAHVRRAYELGARYFYSLLPESAAASDAAVVWGSIEERYWPHPVPARGDRMVRPVDLDGNPPMPSDCAHLVGWKRLSA